MVHRERSTSGSSLSATEPEAMRSQSNTPFLSQPGSPRDIIHDGSSEPVLNPPSTELQEREEEEINDPRNAVADAEPTFDPTSGATPELTPEPTSENSCEITLLHSRFLLLAKLPARLKPIPQVLRTPFQTAAERLADHYLRSPSETTLLDFLALPKVGLVPALRIKQGGQRLSAYPRVKWPEAYGLGRGSTKERTVKKLVEAGRLGSAARILTEDSKVAEVNEETIEELRSKHPEGPVRPFGDDAGPRQGRPPTAEEIMLALDSFKSDTAPGVSGWTVPLLRLACRSPRVVEFLTSLTAAIGANTAPGRSMLRVSRLTPLMKPSGGIRPIAVGELLYRLSAKALLRKSFKSDFLLPYQLGVGSKGGVEPIVRAVERAVDGTLGAPFTHFVSLDASNAFNAIDRTVIAGAMRQHAPLLYRTAKWAYGEKSDLVIGDTILHSSQGVRQGDPLGPLLFSVGLRSTLSALATHLGPHRRVMAYLDDIYILSTDGSAQEDAAIFFSSHTGVLALNTTKTTSITLEDVRSRGVEMLGTVVGSEEARRAFLQSKISIQAAKLDGLKSLPHQHALLLLRQCLQQDLRHLQRTLRTDDIMEEWDSLDEVLWAEVKRMRGRLIEDEPQKEETSKRMCQLPARHGGLGLLSHRACAPHAHAAASETADELVESLFDVSDLEDRGAVKPQRERCRAMWEEEVESLMTGMDDVTAEDVRRKWLNLGSQMATNNTLLSAIATLGLRHFDRPSLPYTRPGPSPNLSPVRGPKPARAR